MISESIGKGYHGIRSATHDTSLIPVNTHDRRDIGTDYLDTILGHIDLMLIVQAGEYTLEDVEKGCRHSWIWTLDIWNKGLSQSLRTLRENTK